MLALRIIAALLPLSLGVDSAASLEVPPATGLPTVNGPERSVSRERVAEATRRGYGPYRKTYRPGRRLSPNRKLNRFPQGGADWCGHCDIKGHGAFSKRGRIEVEKINPRDI